MRSLLSPRLSLQLCSLIFASVVAAVRNSCVSRGVARGCPLRASGAPTGSRSTLWSARWSTCRWPTPASSGQRRVARLPRCYNGAQLVMSLGACSLELPRYSSEEQMREKLIKVGSVPTTPAFLLIGDQFAQRLWCRPSRCAQAWSWREVLRPGSHENAVKSKLAIFATTLLAS